MMVKITETCTMDCKHCLNDARPNGRDMIPQRFEDVLDFFKKYGIGKCFAITGGEPLEHSSFPLMVATLADWNEKNDRYVQIVTVTTNGERIIKSKKTQEVHEALIAYAKKAGIELIYQVSADVRYYPRRISTHKKIFREPGFVLCDDCVEYLYPQGRTLTNNLPWDKNDGKRKPQASKCFNVRSIAHQIQNCTLKNIEDTLTAHLQFCTPHIKVDGSIGLGESDLCPSVASIYDDEKTIINNILNFKCKGCSMLNDRLGEPLKQLIGEA